jgi:hypothetical protein
LFIHSLFTTLYYAKRPPPYPKIRLVRYSGLTCYSLLILCGVTESEDKIHELEQTIRQTEERICELSVDVMDAKVAIESAIEHHKGLITERDYLARSLGGLRTKLEYAKDGLH